MEIDAQKRDYSRFSQFIHFMRWGEVPPSQKTLEDAHRIADEEINKPIDSTCQSVCQDKGIDPLSDSPLNWRNSIRYMAQNCYRIASEIKNFKNSPRRFELQLVARDISAEIAENRRAMLNSLPAQPT